MEVAKEKTGRLEEEIREMTELGEKTKIYMVSEGSRVDWGDLAWMEEEKVIDVSLMTREGGNKKKSLKNPWNSSESETEKRDK